jgi:hypothetical protein
MYRNRNSKALVTCEYTKKIVCGAIKLKIGITTNSESSLGISLNNESTSKRIVKHIAYMSIGTYISVQTLIDVTIESIA